MPIELFLADVPQRRRAAALYDQLRDAIEHGRLRSGDRLPTSRELAADIGLSRSTVTTVYGRLVAEGYAGGRTGDGTFVSDVRSTPTRRATPAVGDSRAQVWAADLRTGRPDPELFPVVEWRRAAVSVLQAAPPGYGDPGGLPALRAALASWVARSRGVRATAEQVVVTAGAQGAFDLLARTLLGPGTTIAVENPGYPPARRAFRAAGTDVVGVPVDDDGIVVRRIPARAKAVCVTPSHQAPTGAVLSMARRRELLARDLLVIEDDYDTEHRYVDRPLEPLQRLDVTDRVVYVGSFSKTLTPSLRIGFVVAPARLAERLVTTRAAIDTQPAHLTQAALAEFLTSGGFERHLRRSRRAYRRATRSPPHPSRRPRRRGCARRPGSVPRRPARHRPVPGSHGHRRRGQRTP